MKCFIHRDRDAIGVCKACGRTLCEECCADLGFGLACKRRCEEVVSRLNAMIEHNIRMTPTTMGVLRSSRSTTVWSGAFMLTLGSVFLVLAFVEYLNYGQIGFAAAIGAVMTLYGALSIARALRMPVLSQYPVGFCQKCGYDLVGNTSGRCPECGKETAGTAVK